MIPTTYDAEIEAACSRFLEVDWRLYKAQLYQESLLDPDAVSHAGAKGLAQFLAGTWGDVKRDLGFPDDASPFDPEYAIPAGAHYMAERRAFWSWPRPEADRYALALASYNAGAGNVVKAQRIASMATAYAPIIARLVDVTGANNAHETRTYVRRIFGYYARLITEGT